MRPPVLLLISPHPRSKTTLEHVLTNHNANLLVTSTSEEGLQTLAHRPDIDCIVADETGSAIQKHMVLSAVRRLAPSVPVILLGAENSAKAAVEALRRGATDYLPEPVMESEIEAALLRIPAFAGHMTAVAADPASPFDRIVSSSPQMKLVKHLATEVAASDATVLITGESGTGKELFARAIHGASSRSKGPFVALNCAGIPEHLLESELFGYQKGAFTDAKQSKAGRFQMAEGGTLFLDEIGEMSPMAQAKLLRVLEDHAVSPLGQTHDIPVNIRVIAATNEDLPAQIKAGRFRLDLYYRLNVYQLRIPPLRERLDDIEPIVRSFLETARRDHGRRAQRISPDALAALRRHDWPGNVRELHNVIEGLTITCKDPVIGAEHLPVLFNERSSGHKESGQHSAEKASLLAFGLSFQEMERKLLMEALRQAGGNVSEASRLLKLTRNTLRYRMAKYRLC